MAAPPLTTPPQTSAAYVLPFSALDRHSVPVAGGKAANLGELVRAGLPVPPGYCVTTAAYAAVAGGSALDPILDALAMTAPSDTARLEELAEQARQALLDAPVPNEIVAAIARAYRELAQTRFRVSGAGEWPNPKLETRDSKPESERATGSGQPVPVAVRSSATAEDLPGASFAGQQETYLNVVGEDAVVAAVRRCWASLWTGRAVAYRASNGVDQRSVQLAVAVQEMVDAAVAGVMFTANPLTGRRRQAVIDASPGLGEAVVSGAVTPDHFVVDVDTGRIVERHLGDKRLKIVAVAGGGTERVESRPAPPPFQPAPAAPSPFKAPPSPAAPSPLLAPPTPATPSPFVAPPSPAVPSPFVAPPSPAAVARGLVPRQDVPPTTNPPPTGAAGPCLTDHQLRALARLAARVEAHFGQPQDTEWALDAQGTFWLVQSRPITTLFPLPATAPPAGSDLRVYFNFSVAQGVFRPFTPMGIQAFRLIFGSLAGLLGSPPRDPIAGPSFVVEAAGRLFGDITPVVRSALGRRTLRAALRQGEARSGELLDALFADPRLAVRQVHPLRTVVFLGGLLGRLGASRRILTGLLRPAHARRSFARAADRALILGDLPAGASAAERLDAFERLLTRFPPELMPAAILVLPPGLLSLFLAGRLLRGLATPQELETVRRSLPYNPTTEMDLELWALAQRIRADLGAAAALRGQAPDALAAAYREGTLPDTVQRGLAGFLRQYGHRGVAEIDLGLPRWSEHPAHILGVLANYLQVEDPEQAPDAQFRRGAAAAEAMLVELKRRARRRGRLRGALVGLLLRRGRQLAGQREAPKFYIVAVLAKARALLLPVGEALAQAGRLAAAGDIFFLTLPEARAALAGTDWRETVRERRATYARELQRRHLPRLLLSDGTEPAPAAAAAAQDGILRGAPASAGIVTGSARVILDPQGARLAPGEILVAPSTDPGWTPLFLTAGGLVMEMGGPMSHGAIVAREYGIPAVVGVPAATERISTGQRITIDGGAGTIAAAG